MLDFKFFQLSVGKAKLIEIGSVVSEILRLRQYTFFNVCCFCGCFLIKMHLVAHFKEINKKLFNVKLHRFRSPVSSPVTVDRIRSNLRFEREGNVTIRMPLANTKNSGYNPIDATLVNPSLNVTNVSRSDTRYKRGGIATIRKPMADNTNYGGPNVTLINSAGSTSSNGDFCEMFTGWLKKNGRRDRASGFCKFEGRFVKIGG